MTLKSFPRGGKKPYTKAPDSAPISHKNIKGHKKRKYEGKDRTDKTHVESTLRADITERLSLNKLQEGLVVLGRICEVTEYNLTVSLPGGITGYVQITNISEAYTNLLQNIVKEENGAPTDFSSLPELYNLGDFVVCYVKSVHSSEKPKVDLSLDPTLINQYVDVKYLSKGSKVVCTVSSVEDHGYVVHTGISNVRAFIPVKEIDVTTKCFPGKQLLCAIKHMDTTDNVTTIKLSAKKKKTEKPSENDVASLDTLIPGTTLTLYIKSVLPNGLEVQFGTNNIGYINQVYLTDELSSYAPEMEIVGTLLYVVPTVKFAYFSLLTNEIEKEKLQVGEVIGKAKVLCREPNGIVLKLTPTLRGFISLRRTAVDYTAIVSKFKIGSKHKCRILAYSWMERMYVCTMEHSMLEQKYFTCSDFTPGDIITVTIVGINMERGFVNVKVDRVYGFICPEHVSDNGLSILSKLKVAQEIKARVLSIEAEKNKVQYTLKESLMKSKFPILKDISEAKQGAVHNGTVVKINKNGLLVQFFGGVKGWVPHIFLNKDAASTNWGYCIGQTVAAYIEEVKENEHKLLLRIHKEDKIKVDVTFSVGELVEGTIADCSTEGIYLRIVKNEETVTGYLPSGHMAPCAEIGSLLASKCIPGDVLSALVFATTPSLLLSRTFVPEEQYRNLKSLKVGDSIPCSVRDITEDGMRVILPLTDYETFGYVPRTNINNIDLLRANQILFAKITSINRREKQLGLTTSLEKVWTDDSGLHSKLMMTVDALHLYLNKLAELAKSPYYVNRPISSMHIGQRVTGKVEKITDYGLVVKLDNDLQGTVRKEHYNGNIKIGDSVSGAVLWVNYVHEYVDLTVISTTVNSIKSKQSKLPNLPLDTPLYGHILLITHWFILVIVKYRGIGHLVVLPARRHINDVQPDLSPYVIGTRLKCYVMINRNAADVVPICVLKSAFELHKQSQSRTSTIEVNLVKRNVKRKHVPTLGELLSTKKPKLSSYAMVTTGSNMTNKRESKNTETGDVVESNNEETDVDMTSHWIVEQNSVVEEGQTQKKKSKKKEKQKRRKESQDTTDNDVEEKPNVTEIADGNCDDRSDDKEAMKLENQIISSNKPSIPECGFLWNSESNLDVTNKADSSSDSEEEDQQQLKQKKKLSAAERREMERQKEREIRQREEALASNNMPNSVDQFDRLVLSSPNSSLVWIQYMAYHLQATEIEKARAVARRAVKTINFREETEKLNLWNAWLNLESKFGTVESLNDVFQEAIRNNDALKVYLHMLTVHADAGRQVEMEKLVNTIIAKFRENPQIWIDCGKALLKAGLKERSRHVMQRALQSLPLSQHVNVMVQFAHLENKYGDKERAQTLFEQVLSSYPKRVDIWSSYTDALIKSGDINLARKVLERAVVQTLPGRKMKTLFKKFISFEEQYGTPSSVAAVQQMAVDYVESQCQKESV